jgi:4-amino-4-deoxy-L-arabinose transferase-like glycosyltransferase
VRGRRHPTNGAARSPGRISWLRRTAEGALIVLALSMLATSFVPLDTLREHVDVFAVDRDAGVTQERYDRFVLKLRLLAIGMVALVAWLHVSRDRVDAEAGTMLADARSAVRGSPCAVRAWLAAESYVHVAALVAITAVGVVLRASFLDVPLRYDEATTFVNYVSKPIYVALSNYSAPNNHLLHTALAYAATHVGGTGEIALRMPALVAGVAVVPVTYVLGRSLYGGAAGLLAAGLVAGSSTLVEYSANARGYTILLLLATLGLIAAARYVERGTHGSLAALAVTAGLGLFTIPTMVYAFAGTLAWVGLSMVRNGRPLRGIVRPLAWCTLGGAALAAILYVPVLAVSGPRAIVANEYVTALPVTTFVDQLDGHLLETARAWTRDLPVAVTAILTASLVASLAFHRRIARTRVPVLPVLVAVALVMIVAQRTIPFPRVWLYLVPVACVTCAALPGYVLGQSRARWLTPAAALSVAVAGAVLVASADTVRTSRETGGLLDARLAADVLRRNVTPRDRIFAPGSEPIVDYYLLRRGLDAEPLIYEPRPGARTFVVVNVLGGQTVDQLLEELGASGSRRRPARLVRSDSLEIVVVPAAERRRPAG